MGKRGPQPTGNALTPAERMRRSRQRKREQADKQHAEAPILGGFERYVLRELAIGGESETDTANRLLTELLHTLAAPECSIEERTHRLLASCLRKLRNE